LATIRKRNYWHFNLSTSINLTSPKTNKGRKASRQVHSACEIILSGSSFPQIHHAIVRANAFAAYSF